MGEVYRADDLKLGQPVALKFLPDRLSLGQGAPRPLLRRGAHRPAGRASERLPRLRHRRDRRTSLPLDGVRGRRGPRVAPAPHRRLPPDKALEISRQICAGLAAAHERGILHRDLKPANVMVDGRGRARIMDFGLAVAAGRGRRTPKIGGTPAYMAPEQFAGKGASVRSDLYALGLVLYELYTGKQAFDAPKSRRLSPQARGGSANRARPRSSTGMDPAVERRSCAASKRTRRSGHLRRPRSRPHCPEEIRWRRRWRRERRRRRRWSRRRAARAASRAAARARLCSPTVVVLLAALLALVGKTNFLAADRSEKPPEVLRARAREILAGLGMPGPPGRLGRGPLQDIDFVDVGDGTRPVDRPLAQRHRARRDRLRL